MEARARSVSAALGTLGTLESVVAARRAASLFLLGVLLLLVEALPFGGAGGPSGATDPSRGEGAAQGRREDFETAIAVAAGTSLVAAADAEDPRRGEARFPLGAQKLDFVLAKSRRHEGAPGQREPRRAAVGVLAAGAARGVLTKSELTPRDDATAPPGEPGGVIVAGGGSGRLGHGLAPLAVLEQSLFGYAKCTR